jgi:hypothetical protein
MPDDFIILCRGHASRRCVGEAAKLGLTLTETKYQAEKCPH